ncbi:hypothetical protein OsJ_34505 [Oryza sativa Japonica Group]|uniref:Uncharacterized protein n=1 Tax=Oryza sativa subsp. japonica TaxID=39947 RepID=B9G8D5_ORYSJ|nr:hypothetical protein OsJ_34505 [Oryza sativa Japonica Group]
MGLDNAGKTTTLYKLHLGEAVTTAPPSAAMSRRSSSRTSDSRSHLLPSPLFAFFFSLGKLRPHLIYLRTGYLSTG